jgi:hypothetical protein
VTISQSQPIRIVPRKEKAMTKATTKSLRVVLAFFVTLAATAALAQSDAQKSFAQLKSLSGDWTGKASKGNALEVTFRETAGGSAVMSEIHGHGPENMVSMFHMDGPNRLLITHYCGAGNQPRMQASTSADGKTITFTFIDATNLATPDAGHMSQLVIAVLDANHHTEDWTFLDHGKEMKEFFDLRRKM